MSCLAERGTSNSRGKRMAETIYGPDGATPINQVIITTANLRKAVNDRMRQAQGPQAIDLLAATLAQVGRLVLEMQQETADIKRRIALLEAPPEEGE